MTVTIERGPIEEGFRQRFMEARRGLGIGLEPRAVMNLPPVVRRPLVLAIEDVTPPPRSAERDYLLVSSDPPPTPFRAQRIIAYVAAKHGVSINKLKSPRRARYLVRPRHEAFYRLHEETDLSLPQIGRLLNRDHTTALYGIRKHKERMEAAAK